MKSDLVISDNKNNYSFSSLMGIISEINDSMSTIPFSENKIAIKPSKWLIATPPILANTIEAISPIKLVPTPRLTINLPILIL